jgi:hypothetical protein
MTPEEAKLLALAKELVKEASKKSPGRDHMNEILDEMKVAWRPAVSPFPMPVRMRR